MQTASSKIKTQLIESISYGDNHHTKCPAPCKLKEV